MQIISLNTWGGQKYDALMEFVRSNMVDTDIFCFQEMTVSNDGPKVSHSTRTNLFKEIGGLLKDFVRESVSFESGFDEAGPVDFDLRWAQAIFVREGIEIVDFGSTIIHEGDETHRNEFDHRSILQYVELEIDGKSVTVCNVHGVAYPGSKLDTPNRLRQSERIKKFTDEAKGLVILCGDFNLMPETESIRMLEDKLENLIITHRITSTRGSLNQYFGTPEQQDFADYTFVSSGVTVERFSVPDARVSDHLPMILRFLV